MAPVSEPSTPVLQSTNVSDRQIFETPHMETVSSYAEETPVDKSDMTFPFTIQAVQYDDLYQFAIDSEEEEDTGMFGSSGNEASVFPNIANNLEVEDSDVSDAQEDSASAMPSKQLCLIRKEWLGTSQLLDDPNLEMQVQGQLDEVILLIKLQFADLALYPYDPIVYIQVANSLNRIGFSDVGAGYSYRALLLVKAGLGIEDVHCIPNLKQLVSKAIKSRFKNNSEVIIEEELKVYQSVTYITLLDALMGSSAFWDGLIAAQEAMLYFPHDADIIEMHNALKDAFMHRNSYCKGQGLQNNELRVMTRTGKIWQKKYPWMSDHLFYRTPALLKQINKKFGSGNCEVRSVVFGTDASLGPEKLKNEEDAGPCGIFATRDIRGGEYVMVDTTVLGISETPASKRRYCEACHAALYSPYMLHPDQFKPSCCGEVAYCSSSCAKNAAAGYHKVLCGKNFDWVYEIAGLKSDEGLGSAWRPVMFLRMAAVILGDNTNGIPHHPLQHPAIARLGANYTRLADHQLQPETDHGWRYTENIVAPTKILLQLGVNIFTTPCWSPEVIQTTIFRLDNNANMASIRTEPGQEAIDMINVNGQYVFFNHSCHPNVNWHSSPPNAHVNIAFAMDEHGNVHRPGESTVFCDAARDIKKGEQLFISYIGDPLGRKADPEKHGNSGSIRFMGREGKRALLCKWFENGCGCVTCETENRKTVADAEAKRLLGVGVEMERGESTGL